MSTWYYQNAQDRNTSKLYHSNLFHQSPLGNSPPPSAEVKNLCCCTSTPPCLCVQEELYLCLAIRWEPGKYSQYSDWATGWIIQGLNPSRGIRFSFLQNVQTSFWGPSSPLFNRHPEHFVKEQIGQSMKLTTYLHQMQKLRTGDDIHSLSLYAYMACAKTNLL
jgi:hypothetical protein